MEAGQAEARRIITEKRDSLETLARGLIEYETLTGDEIRNLLNGIPPVRDTGEDTAGAPSIGGSCCGKTQLGCAGRRPGLGAGSAVLSSVITGGSPPCSCSAKRGSHVKLVRQTLNGSQRRVSLYSPENSGELEKMSRKFFGTDGIRGLANKVITPELALKVGQAAGIVFQTEIIATAS